MASTYLKNKAVRNIYNFTLFVKPHSGNPEPDGLQNTLTGLGSLLSSDLVPGDTGELTNNVSVALGITDNTKQTTITHLSLWDGDNYLGPILLDDPLDVLAGTSPRIKKNTIILSAEEGGENGS